MSKLYILGAGCSRNYTEGTTNIPGLASPLDNDFFKMAKRVITNRTLDLLLSQSIDGLVRDLCRMYGCNPEEHPGEHRATSDEKYLAVFDNPYLSLENVMTTLSLESDLFLKPFYLYGYPMASMFHSSTRLAPLVELIAITIAEALRGPICKKHKELAEGMQPGDVIFSYNYDILMDNALRALDKLTDNGYMLSFRGVFNNIEWTKSEERDSPVSILKLHGSLNWIRCSFCSSNFLLRHQKIGEWIETVPEICPKCGAEKFYIERVIVPPLLTKNYSDPNINYLWLEAHRSIRKIDEIIIIGYSLPPTDFASETLFRTGGFWETRKEIAVTVVNPNKEVVDRFSKIFDPSKITWKQSLDDYLSTT